MIVFYCLQSSLVEIAENRISEKVTFGIFETEKERNDTSDFLSCGNTKVITFDLTQENMDLFNLKTKEDVKEKLRKEFENTRHKIGNFSL